MTTKQFGAGQFDERQLLIRSQVLLHGLFVVLGLLLVNAFLAAANISWANGFTQNLGILFVTSAVVASESMFRGVFFGRRNGSHWPMILVYGIWGLTLIITPGFLWSPNDTVAAPADHVVALVCGALWVVTALIGIGKELTDRRIATRPEPDE